MKELDNEELDIKSKVKRKQKLMFFILVTFQPLLV